MKVVTVSGIQGSGKTTLIHALVASLASQGKQSAIIVNEEGEETYSPEFLETYAAEIYKLRGG